VFKLSFFQGTIAGGDGFPEENNKAAGGYYAGSG